MQDDYIHQNSILFLNPLKYILPNIKVEYTGSQRLNIEDVKGSNTAESSSNFNYQDGFYNAFKVLKTLDVSVDAFKFVLEPSYENINILVRDIAHFGVVYTNTANYLPIVNVADISVLFYNGEYVQAIKQVGITAGHMLMPTMFGTALAPMYSGAILAYTSYKLAENIYNLYSNYATAESMLKSNIAYAILESKLGLQESAKKCLLNAMRIVEKDYELNNDSDSLIQQIALKFDLAGMVCELEPSYEFCLKIDY